MPRSMAGARLSRNTRVPEGEKRIACETSQNRTRERWTKTNDASALDGEQRGRNAAWLRDGNFLAVSPDRQRDDLVRH